MSRSRLALLGGPAFFISWFVAAQILYFASGGTTDGGPLPGPDEFPAVVLSNRSSVYAGATLLAVAGVFLLWFAAGLRDRVRSDRGLDLIGPLGAATVAVLVFLEAGLVAASVRIAESAPEASWTVDQLSGAVGFESFLTSLLGAVAAAGVIVAADQNTISKWFWRVTIVIGVILSVAGVLEGFDLIPAGRFAIIFGLWVAIAGFALQASPQQAAEHFDRT